MSGTDDVETRFNHIVLADFQCYSKGEIMLEIGADIYPQIVRSGLLHPNNGTMAAQNTAFCWTLTGDNSQGS